MKSLLFIHVFLLFQYRALGQNNSSRNSHTTEELNNMYQALDYGNNLKLDPQKRISQTIRILYSTSKTKQLNQEACVYIFKDEIDNQYYLKKFELVFNKDTTLLECKIIPVNAEACTIIKKYFVKAYTYHLKALRNPLIGPNTDLAKLAPKREYKAPEWQVSVTQFAPYKGMAKRFQQSTTTIFKSFSDLCRSRDYKRLRKSLKIYLRKGCTSTE